MFSEAESVAIRASLPAITHENPLGLGKLMKTKDRVWRRGWDSHHCRLLKTKNLRDFASSRSARSARKPGRDTY